MTSATRRTSPWFVRGGAAPASGLRLFCFPYAGGGASIFRSWQAQLPSEVEVCAVQLPGRESRLGEPAVASLPALVAALARELKACEPEGPFALFGHSLGARLAYEAALALVEAGARAPSLLVVSGAPPPHLPSRCRPIHRLATEEFIAELGKLGGTPREILAERELMELFLPALRADFALDEAYLREEIRPLPCPIVACFGSGDDTARSQDVLEWARYTRGPFTLRGFAGDHFFLRAQERELLAFLGEALSVHDTRFQVDRLPIEGAESRERGLRG